MARSLARTDFTSDLNGATEPQELFSERRFTSVRVRNDGKGAAAGDFFVEQGHGKQAKSGKAALYIRQLLALCSPWTESGSTDR